MSEGMHVPAPPDLEVRGLLEAIFERFHYDFRSYSMASLKRRVASAMASFGVSTVQELERLIVVDEAKFTRLVGFLTVQVSEMFRDPGYFKTFRERIVPELRTYPSIRIWVAGCSAGEEAYSFAVLLKEEGVLDRSLIYATDINVESLERAKAGIYPLDRMKTFCENHQRTGAKLALSEHYTAGTDSAVFDRSFRPHLVFSDHSLSTDNVFAEVQVVSCRNVLIYFDRTLQDRALTLFRGALRRRGFLGLGAKETVQFSAQADAFAEYVWEDRWYRRT